MEDNKGLEELRHKVDNLEYKELNPLKERVGRIEVSLAENNVLTKQSVETSAKLTETMGVVKETMIQLAESMKASNKVAEELSENVKTLSTQFVGLDNKVDSKFNEVDERISKIDDKSKFDIMEWIKSNFVSVVLAIGAVTYLISQYIK